MPNVTHLLKQISTGDRLAVEELWRPVYNELRGIAAAKLAQEKPGHTLQRAVNFDHRWDGVAAIAARRACLFPRTTTA